MQVLICLKCTTNSRTLSPKSIKHSEKKGAETAPLGVLFGCPLFRYPFYSECVYTSNMQVNANKYDLKIIFINSNCAVLLVKLVHTLLLTDLGCFQPDVSSRESLGVYCIQLTGFVHACTENLLAPDMADKYQALAAYSPQVYRLLHKLLTTLT